MALSEVALCSIDSFRSAIPVTKYREFAVADQHFPDGWELVSKPESSTTKLTALNRDLGVFLKLFCPNALNFSLSASVLLSELCNLQLPIPFLPPLHLSGNEQVFPLGTPLNSRKITEAGFTIEHITRIETMVSQKGHTSLYSFKYRENVMLLDLVQYEGTTYAVDVLDDSTTALNTFDERDPLAYRVAFVTLLREEKQRLESSKGKNVQEARNVIARALKDSEKYRELFTSFQMTLFKKGWRPETVGDIYQQLCQFCGHTQSQVRGCITLLESLGTWGVKLAEDIRKVWIILN